MTPSAIRFKAVEALPRRGACKGCLFDAVGVAICHEANRLAKLAGMPDCDDRAPGGQSYVYVLDETDPRQLPLIPPEPTA